MKRVILLIAISVMALMTGYVYAGPAAPLSTPELKSAIGSGKKNTIVFFINPQGGPCRAQKEILLKLHKDRRADFNIAYVSTTRAEDQRAFYDYGVRNLPTLVLVDKSGQISRFFPPGIQNYDTLAAVLNGTR